MDTLQRSKYFFMQRLKKDIYLDIGFDKILGHRAETGGGESAAL